MLTVADMEPHIEREFGSRLEPLGFRRLSSRKWVRSAKLPLRELFIIGPLKGKTYCPIWGISSGLVPAIRSGKFKRQSTDKNATMDLKIDPIDIPGEVPPQAFSFIPSYHLKVPKRGIRRCAKHFVPLAVRDFDRVASLRDFCNFFLERSQLQYRRFKFFANVRHRLAHGFVLLLTGQLDEGLSKIQEFCWSEDMEFEDEILATCIRHAQSQDTIT